MDRAVRGGKRTVNDEWLRSERAALVRERVQNDPPWLIGLRDEAFGLFESQGLPTPKLEEWRYTNLSPVERLEFETGHAPRSAPGSAEALQAACAPGDESPRFVFVDGRYDEGLSAARSECFQSLATLRRQDPGVLRNLLGGLADTKRHALAALNTAFLDDGTVIRVPRGTELEEPIHLLFLSSPGATRIQHPRVLVELGEGSRAQIIQEHRSAGGDVTFTNAVSEIYAMQGSAVDFLLLQHENESAYHVSDTSVSLDRDARIRMHTVTLGGRLVRNDLRVQIQGEGAECSLEGLFLAEGGGLIDNHTEVDHRVPHGTSRELYKGILHENSKGVFRGRVIVSPDAQKTDARQHNPNLLLGEGAEIDSRPQLEIRADDVKCGHGTSIGRLEEEALFYLRSRGIDPGRAMVLLTEGFANEVLDSIPVEGLAARIGAELRNRLATERADS